MVFLLRILKICTENVQINTIKTGMNKELVLGDPLPPLDGQRPYFRAFLFWDPSLSIILLHTNLLVVFNYCSKKTLKKTALYCV